MTVLSRERLEELRDVMLNQRDEKEIAAALDELLALRDAQEWVPWKPGDSDPSEPGRYWCTVSTATAGFGLGFLDVIDVLGDARNFELNRVIAYLPTKLPSAYSPQERAG